MKASEETTEIEMLTSSFSIQSEDPFYDITSSQIKTKFSATVTDDLETFSRSSTPSTKIKESKEAKTMEIVEISPPAEEPILDIKSLQSKAELSGIITEDLEG